MVSMELSFLHIFVASATIFIAMKKEYLQPETVEHPLYVEQALLTGSIYGDAPVSEAIEGDTDTWGDWL